MVDIPIEVEVSFMFLDDTSRYISLVVTPSMPGIRSPPISVEVILVQAEKKIVGTSIDNNGKNFFTKIKLGELLRRKLVIQI